MRTIIAGSRTINDPYVLLRAIDNCGWEPTVIIGGMAKGADELGKQYAKDCGLTFLGFPAAWKDLYGNMNWKAGFERNLEMAKHGQALIALWDGQSNGTANMIDTAKRLGLVVHVELV